MPRRRPLRPRQLRPCCARGAELPVRGRRAGGRALRPRADPDPLPAAPAGLVYVSDTAPGITRRRKGKGFSYCLSDGRILRDAKEIDRIRRLAIPPAYTQVWICPRANGHLQATGRDARGRKQYRYHPDWHAARDLDKFTRLRAFGEALPRIRRRVQRDLDAAARGGLPRDTVLATLVRLLDTTLVRVGNVEYARENGSFGLTTLRTRHAKVAGSTLRLRFKGKSGVVHDVAVDDPRVARVVRRCQALPGQELFQYLDADGDACDVHSHDVNDYLQACTGQHFTAKDFRTWHASALALGLLSALAADGPVTRVQLNEAVRDVARRLGNTLAVCRKSYVHPDVLAAAEAGQLAALMADAPRRLPTRGLTVPERQLLCFLAGACRPRRVRR